MGDEAGVGDDLAEPAPDHPQYLIAHRRPEPLVDRGQTFHADLDDRERPPGHCGRGLHQRQPFPQDGAVGDPGERMDPTLVVEQPPPGVVLHRHGGEVTGVVQHRELAVGWFAGPVEVDGEGSQHPVLPAEERCRPAGGEPRAVDGLVERGRQRRPGPDPKMGAVVEQQDRRPRAVDLTFEHHHDDLQDVRQHDVLDDQVEDVDASDELARRVLPRTVGRRQSCPDHHAGASPGPVHGAFKAFAYRAPPERMGPVRSTARTLHTTATETRTTNTSIASRAATYCVATPSATTGTESPTYAPRK